MTSTPVQTSTPAQQEPRNFDVVILGGGLAGLTLARHLALHTDRSVALVERRDTAPSRPKVGESTVQLAGYYFGRVLDLERNLFDEHYLKYNLRFYWPAQGEPGDDFSQFSQVYLRTFSNICSFQIDRNRFEDAVRERLVAADAVEFFQPAERLRVEIGEGDALHRVTFTRLDQSIELHARWVVDATGRNKFLQKHLHRSLPGDVATETPLAKASPIRHGASFLWVDGGLDGGLDLERMTRHSRNEVRLSPRRQRQGHTPQWLATNHFCGEGWWLWVIPLRGLTSIGLVFDSEVIDFSTVSSAPLLLDWIRKTLPLFCRELENRNVVGHSGFRDFAHDCRLTLSPDR
ncbi:MAG: FAD-dependent oxidoreductase, partial [Thermoanaerobaculia bacterium]|nr:FAD-dependent oxidoreductase [Thermoanaerobaculia bacterium]